MAATSPKTILIAGRYANSAAMSADMAMRGYAVERASDLDDTLARLRNLAPHMVLIAAELIPKAGRQAMLQRLRALDQGALIVLESTAARC